MQITYTSSSTSTPKTSTRPDTGVVAQISDEALVESIAEGDRGALETLYMRHHAQLYRLLLRRIGRESVAEEIVNEVFLEVWRNAHRFEAKARVATWLIAIARYKALSELSVARKHDWMTALLQLSKTQPMVRQPRWKG